VAATANALSSAQLAAEYPRAGGAYEYGNRVLHPWAGFAAGWMFLASKIAAAGTVALGLGAYVDALAPGLPARPVAVLAIVVFTALNYVGIRRSSRANLVIVSVSIGALVAFVLAGAPAFRARQPAALRARWLVGHARGGRAALLRLYRVRAHRHARRGSARPRAGHPARDRPDDRRRRTALHIVALVAVGAVGAPGLATAAPLHAAAQAFPLAWVATVVSLGRRHRDARRHPVAAARHLADDVRHGTGGDLPRSLEHLHPRYRPRARRAARRRDRGDRGGDRHAAGGRLRRVVHDPRLLRHRQPCGAADATQAKRYSDAVPIVGLASCTLLALSLTPPVILTGTALLAAGFMVRAAVRGAAGSTPNSQLPTPTERGSSEGR
jgi:basic amino acid/polyamine antiporter, APA family